MLTIYGEVVELESTPLVTCVRDPIEGIRFATLFREVVIDARAIFPYGETLWGPARARYRLESISALRVSVMWDSGHIGFGAKSFKGSRERKRWTCATILVALDILHLSGSSVEW